MSAAPAGAETGPFAARTVLAMVLAGVFAFAAFVVLLAYAPDLSSGRDGGGHALSRSATGFAGVVELARSQGMTVEVVRGRQKPAEADGLRVLTPDAFTAPQSLAAALDRGSSQTPVLVVLPKWLTTADPLHPGWVRRAGMVSEGSVARPLGKDRALKVARRQGDGPARLAAVDAGAGALPGRIGKVRALQTVSAPGARTLIADEAGRAVLVALKDGVLVLADPDLLNTQGVADADTARTAVALLRRLSNGGAVVFDVSINGFDSSRSLLKLAFSPPFLAATLCAVAAAGLIGWHASVRFGPARTPPRAFALGKQALADNSAALLRLAGREPRMAQPYAALALQAAARAAGVPRGLDPQETGAMLDRLASKAGAPETASRLLAEAKAVSDTAGLMRAARKLHAFRRLMTRE